jgi:hypothetical protein
VRQVDKHAADIEDRSLERLARVLLSVVSVLVPGVRGRPELERALLTGAQLADLVADPNADRPPHALPVGG